MRITRLHLQDFRRHADIELRPAAGLTVIRGPNEAGKSTIEQAIELALYGLNAAPGELHRWGAPPEAVPTLELEFSHGESAGSLVRRFAPSGETVALTIGDETISDPEAVAARLADITGMPSIQFFRSTAAVRQGELADLARGDAVLRERLIASMSASDRELARSLRELEAAIRAIDGDGAGAGPLRAAREEVERLAADVERGEAELTALALDQEAVSAARTTLAEVEAKLEIDREEVGVAEEAVRVAAAAREAEANLERLDRAVALRDELATLERRHEAGSTVRAALPWEAGDRARDAVVGPSLESVRDAVARIRELETAITGHREQLAREVDLSGLQVLAPEPIWRPFALAAIVLAVVGVAAVAITQIAGLGIITVLALVYALYAWRQQRRIVDVRRENVLREEQIERRLRGRSDAEARLREAEQAREAELARLGAADLAVAEEKLAAEEQRVNRLQECRAELGGLLGDLSLDSLSAARAQAVEDVAERRRALAELGDLGIDPESHVERCLAAVRLGEQARERARAETISAEAQVEGASVDAEAVAARAEALAAAQERLAAIERRRRILSTTLDALREAELATTRRAARFLEDYIGRSLARITGGRYERVQLDEETLGMRTWSSERGGWVDVRTLSEGTLDQVYMAARLGLVSHLTRDCHPPLVFDDPFITFDDERAVRALEVLRDMSAEHQAIYLTTSSRYDAVANLVIELAGPAPS